MPLKPLRRLFRTLKHRSYASPGVYVTETSTGSRSIEPAETGVCAFIGPFPAGPRHAPLRIDTGLSFERDFGGTSGEGEASLQVAQYFRNGGGAAVLVGTEDASEAALRKGIAALAAAVDTTFDLLSVADATGLPRPEELYTQALALAADRRAMLLLDPPSGLSGAGITAWLAAVPGLRTADAALYHPRLEMPDGRQLAPSGTVAGVIARVDRERGMWKAPAGQDAALRGVSLGAALSDAETEALVPEGINVLRAFPGDAPVVWGARTLETGGDQKYVPVRRLVLFLERSLLDGLRWVAFETNDETLWAAVRSSVDGFLAGLWRAGAFQGTAPRQAWFVRCDRTTMTAVDMAEGRLNLLIGVAPTRPAEFVILTLTLTATPGM